MKRELTHSKCWCGSNDEQERCCFGGMIHDKIYQRIYEGLDKLALAYFDKNVRNEEVLAIFIGYDLHVQDLDLYDTMYDDLTDEEFEKKFNTSFEYDKFYDLYAWMIIQLSLNVDEVFNKEYAGKVKKSIFERLTHLARGSYKNES